MPTTATTTEAARVVASNAHARRMAAAVEAKYPPADTTTPIVPTLNGMPLPDLPDPPAPPPAPAKPKPAIVLSFTTIYRGRQITITGEHMDLDAFCDLLDKRFGVAE